jgi:hypothetical protein
MKLSTLPLALLTSFLISCGDNTTSSPLTEIQSIAINEDNISIYSTDIEVPLTADVIYTDSTTAPITTNVSWNSSDTTQLYTSLGVDATLLTPLINGSDLNLSIEYKTTFKDIKPLHIKELLSLNYSELNVSDIGTPQTIYITGNFENNESNVTLLGNLFWTVDANATITETNSSEITLTVDYNTTSILLKGRLFPDTDNEVDFNKTFIRATCKLNH